MAESVFFLCREWKSVMALKLRSPATARTSFGQVRSFLQSVDLNVTRDSDLLKGRIDLHAQYAWSEVDRQFMIRLAISDSVLFPLKASAMAVTRRSHIGPP